MMILLENVLAKNTLSAINATNAPPDSSVILHAKVVKISNS